jgi:RHH-type proline utilization regulon transcriptional repressor/proline dehydrogenase/delta 1-pyrroline-5-carboxylate dehydrogenase
MPKVENQLKDFLDETHLEDLAGDDFLAAVGELAALILKEARDRQSRRDYHEEKLLARMVTDPLGKAFTTAMNDECFRSQNPRRVAEHLCLLLQKYGVPRFLNPWERLQLQFFLVFGRPFAPLIVPMVKKTVRAKTRQVIIPGESDRLREHLLLRAREGITVNLNHLGEAILGEKEASRRLEGYLADLRRPEVEYISVKVSTLTSQVNLAAYPETLALLAQRLRTLYRCALSLPPLPVGRAFRFKFINLDMEEYRDLRLTLDLFCQVMGEEEFFPYSGGIALQAYLPDAHAIFDELRDFARWRQQKGGAPLKVRLVKGANLLMEKYESSLRGWPVTPYGTKVEVDASFRKFMDAALTAESTALLHVGIGSHNLFDLAYALLLTRQRGITTGVSLEMLEGLASPIRSVVAELAEDLVLYCPAAAEEEFDSAIAYLMRRLDEQTAPDNFLRQSLLLAPDTPEFNKQVEFFHRGCSHVSTIGTSPRRVQDRSQDEPPSAHGFRNEPDTDLSLPANRKWLRETVFPRAQELLRGLTEPVPLFIGGEAVLTDDRRAVTSPNTGAPFYEVCLAGPDALNHVLVKATNAFVRIAGETSADRVTCLRRAAILMQQRRGEIIATMIADAGKTFAECDPEVSEAIDFCNFYAANFEEWQTFDERGFQGKGVVLVTPPWNFPFAIPAGGVAAALVAGNAVILKPAPETPLTAWLLFQIFRDAGFAGDSLQFINCRDEPEGSRLIQDPRVNAVILTGASETARLFARLRPGLDLMAETGGKNVIIVSELCDQDLAIKHIVDSAFGHAGQKCSACSVLLLHRSLVKDSHFLDALVDAAASRRVGPGSDPTTVINPLIRPPEGNLREGLTRLEPGERWLLEPRVDPANPHLVSPGIRLGAAPESGALTTEYFGPILDILPFNSLDYAINLANHSEYGLTGGIITLDEWEQEHWLHHIQVGNAYINRAITGAIVQRQPFGGMKKSGWGRGLKAGGPDYLMGLMTLEDGRGRKSAGPQAPQLAPEINVIFEALRPCLSPEEAALLHLAAADYLESRETWFSRNHDPSQVYGQSNVLRYIPHPVANLLFWPGDQTLDICRVLLAAEVVGCDCRLLAPEGFLEGILPKPLLEALPMGWSRHGVRADAPPESICSEAFPRFRLLQPAPNAWHEWSLEKWVPLISSPVSDRGRIELLHYCSAQAVSHDFHRYGNTERGSLVSLRT